VTARDILARLRALGLEVAVVDRRVRLAGNGTVPGDLAAALRERRVEVLAELEFEAEVERRVEAFRDQARRPGPVPFLVMPGSPDTPGACLSCGADLPTPWPPRCPACIEAAHRVLAIRAQDRPQAAPGGPPEVRTACCPACGQGGAWKRIAGPGEASCLHCGVVAEPTGPGPPPPH
jgi:hypothetical protein